MKSISDLVEILNSQKLYLYQKYKVKDISIFGSYSRHEQNAQSDIDILVSFEVPPGLEFVDLAEYLEDILDIEVDLVSRDGIKPIYFKHIEKELIHV
jgi:predicted nucleotidyltransferase